MEEGSLLCESCGVCAVNPALLMARDVDKLHTYLWVAGQSLAVLWRFGVDFESL